MGHPVEVAQFDDDWQITRDKVESIFCKELSVQSHFIPTAIKPVSVSAAMQYEEGWDVSAHVDLDSVTAMYQAVKAGYASHASDKEKGSKVLVAALEILADAVNFTADHVSCGKDLKPLVVVLENRAVEVLKGSGGGLVGSWGSRAGLVVSGGCLVVYWMRCRSASSTR